LGWIDPEVFARDAAQDHAFQPVQVIESVASGFLNGGDQGFTGIVADHAEQLAQGNNQILAATLLEILNVIGDFGRRFENRLFLRMRIAPFDALAARRTVFGQGDALLLGFGDAVVRDNAAQIQLDFDLVFGLADLDAAADPGHRHGVPIRVQCDVSFHIHDALMKPVDLGNPDRQRLQVCPFDSEQLARNGADVFLVGRIDAIAPLSGLEVEIVPTGEAAAGKEVVVNEVEGTFDACRTIGITEFVGSELKAKAFAKGFHLRHWNHVSPGAAQYDDMSVIDHRVPAASAEKTQSLGQEDLAVEALECRVALEEQHPRVAEHGRCGLRRALLSGDLDQMRRCVMLQLLTRLKLVKSAGPLWLLANAVTSAKSRQRRIGEGQSAPNQFFMDPDEIALAVGPLLQNLLPEGFRFLESEQGWYFRGLRSQDFAYR